MGSVIYTFFYGHGSTNERLFLYLNHAASPFLDAVMPVITSLGSPRLALPCLVLLLLLSLVDGIRMPGRYPAVYLGAMLLTLLADTLLKELFRVPRPPVAIGPDQVRLLGHLSSSWSFPSGHAIFSFMTATVVTHGRGMGWKAPFYLFACLVAWSRIYVGVHYPLDVLAGAVVGVACGLVCWKACELYEGKRPFTR